MQTRDASAINLECWAGHLRGTETSSSRLFAFVQNLTRYKWGVPFRALAVRAVLETILAQSARAPCVVRSGEDAAELVLETTDEDSGKTRYWWPARSISPADIRGFVGSLRSRDALGRCFAVVTEPIAKNLHRRASSVYASVGIEFAVLDCAGFLRHFLHLFHRHRVAFLDAYQQLVLAEPDSAVSFELKQAFLALREAAVADPS